MNYVKYITTWIPFPQFFIVLELFIHYHNHLIYFSQEHRSPINAYTSTHFCCFLTFPYLLIILSNFAPNLRNHSIYMHVLMQGRVSNLTMYTIVLISLALLTSFRQILLSLGAMTLQEATIMTGDAEI